MPNCWQSKRYSVGRLSKHNPWVVAMAESIMGDNKISSIDSKVVAEHEQEEDM